MAVINALANVLRRAPKMFSYYGTKDKRAVTLQRVVAYRILPVGFSVTSYFSKTCWLLLKSFAM